MVVTVLVHDCQPLDPPRLLAGFGDIDDLRVEIAGIAGELLIDEIGDLVRELAKRVRIGASGSGAEVTLGDHVPENEFDLKLAVTVQNRRADKKALRAERRPVGEIRLHCRRARRRDEGGAVDRLEQARAQQIVGNDAGDLAAFVIDPAVGAGEVGDGDRGRGDHTLGDLDAKLRHRRFDGKQHTQQECRKAPRVAGDRTDAGSNGHHLG